MKLTNRCSKCKQIKAKLHLVKKMIRLVQMAKKKMSVKKRWEFMVENIKPLL